jgi:hypothetical protein
MTDKPNTHLVLAAVALVVGAGMMLLMLAHSVVGYILLFPVLLGAIALHHAVRGRRLPEEQTEEIEDRAKRALHFSIFSLNISGAFAVIVVIGYVFASCGSFARYPGSRINDQEQRYSQMKAKLAMERPRLLSIALALAVLGLYPASAHAGPTVGADLDLGTHIHNSDLPPSQGGPDRPLLYIAGFTLRAGWRFDVPRGVFLVPEAGAGWAIERHFGGLGVDSTTGHVVRVLGGGRAGWSGAVAPDLRLEPAVFGHAGLGWYDALRDGTAFDVGLGLDLRIRRRFLVGVQFAYSVVTVWHPYYAALPGPNPPSCVPSVTGPVCPAPGSVLPLADPWIGYGVHACYLFW